VNGRPQLTNGSKTLQLFKRRELEVIQRPIDHDDLYEPFFNPPRKKPKVTTYLLEEERFPNSQMYVYKYDYKPNKNDILESIIAKSTSNAIFSEAHFSQRKDLTGISVQGSSEKLKAIYHYTRVNELRLLSSVDRPNGPNESFKYDSHNRLKTIFRPDGHRLDIKYYHQGNNPVNGVNHYLGELDGRSGRVRELLEPVGPGGKLMPTYSFHYHHHQPVTTVYDVVGHPTEYTYNNFRQLTKITSTLYGKPYSSLQYTWGKRQNFGNLISRSAHSATGEQLFSQTYVYDGNGNPIQEKYEGNIRGNQEQDCLLIERTYSTDGLNLQLQERTSRSETTYDYIPETNLLKAQYLWVDGCIRERHFYHYDINGILIKEIWDDGVVLEEDDICHITERHIRETIPRLITPFGLPSIVLEKALDLSTGKEILIKRTDYDYDLEGHITTENYYNADQVYCGSLLKEYDHKGNCISETNQIGERTQRTYDANGNIAYEQGPRLDYHKEYGFDCCNRKICCVTALGTGQRLHESYRYNTLSQKTALIDHYGNETNYCYDELGRLIETFYPTVLDEFERPYRPTEKRSYNELGHCTSVTDPRGFTTTTQYTVQGKPTQTHYSDGSIEKRTYTIEGWLESVTDPTGVTTLYSYDYRGRIVRTDALAPSGEILRSTSATYNNFHLLSETDAMGLVTTYTYDYTGRKKSIQKEEKETLFVYDAKGHVSEEREKVGDDYRVHCYYYDGLDRIFSEEFRDSQGKLFEKKEYAYDQDGNRILEKYFDGNEFSYTWTDYNFQGKPIKITDAEGNQTHIFYHTEHRNELNQCVACKETIDPLGRRVVIEYDALQRPLRTFTLGIMGEHLHIEFLLYDKASNPQNRRQWIYAAGKKKCEVLNAQLFDGMHRMVYQVEAVGTPEQKTTTNSYDHAGRKIQTLKPDGVKLLYSYDPLSRLSHIQSTDGTIDYSYTYDLNGHILTVHDSTTQTTTYRQYDSYGRMHSETLANGLTLSFGYDELDRHISTQLPDGTDIRYTYNPCHLETIQRKDYNSTFVHRFGQLTTLHLPKELGTISYTVDKVRRPIEISSPHHHETLRYDAVSNVVAHNNNSYSYNELDQLVSEKGSFTHDYQLDSLHNRLQLDAEQHQHNALNQLLQAGQTTYHYDLNGNLIQIGNTHTFKYDAFDRLVEVTKNEEKIAYQYDPFHRRIKKTSSSQEQLFLYQGDNEIGSCTPSGKITELRVLGLGKGAEIGATVAFEFDNELYVPIHDAFGNVTHILNARGEVIEQINYSAFKEESSTGIQKTPWRFSSKRCDPETGFIYFGRRYYMPELGRWLTQDPIGFNDGPNSYAYLHHSPLSYNDLYGLWSVSFEGCVRTAFTIRNFMMNVWDTTKKAGRGFNTGLYNAFCDPAKIIYKEENSNKSRCESNFERVGEIAGIGIGFIPIARGVQGVYRFYQYCRLVRTAYNLANLARNNSKQEIGYELPSITNDTPSLATQELAIEGVKNGPGCSAANAVRLKNSLAAREITSGHAFEKHVLYQGEFTGLIRTREQFANHIENILNIPSAFKQLRNNRTAYWHEETGTVIIRNPNALDGGTVFQPREGFNYYETLR